MARAQARKERRSKIEQLESEFEVPFWKQQEEEQRRWVFKYVRDNLAFILSNTYNFRSKLFHSGENFPEIAQKEDYSDWLPNIFDIPSMDYWEEHGGHSFEYTIEGKKIFLKCSCSKKFEKPIIFNLRVFELIVHNAIQNFLTKTLYPGI